MKSLTVEAATLAEAANRAARVSPVKGASFDKAAGILLELRPDEPAKLRVKATDLLVTYHQRIVVKETGDEDADWRLSAHLLAAILNSFPLDSGAMVTLSEKNAWVHFKAGRRKAQLRPMVDPMPVIKPFTREELVAVPGIGRRLEQVTWATDPAHDVLSGVHFNGDDLIATDRYAVAIAPLKMPVDRPITVPMDALTSLLRNTSEVRLRADDRRLLMMPDDDTQMSATIYQAPFPQINRVVREEFGGWIGVDRTVLTEAVNRMLVLVRTERYPKLQFGFGDGVLALTMNAPEVGRMEDELDVSGGVSDLFEVGLTPQRVLGALAACDHDAVKLSFGPKATQPVRFHDGEFTAWLAPVVKK